ncbi:DUF4369 domain-containing protein [Abyssalbus ytuae]|uniref:DUF4369 domain-containing protein n=1 Tax=Abyssalbus ytuae TaxID=2926907 RepID=A0A9E7D2Q0_9FLAO|nr:DUF4369 domain-containing protein [Abyssalbus ytuae]UOB16929.1 DUF4369 domain-containing protein [Abyssalbus ytuae]
MKKIYCLIFAVLFMISCSKEKGNLQITGNVKGLKKGTLYLQKINDTLLVNIDSLTVDGKSDFSFSTNIEEPEIMFLYLNKNDGNNLNDRLEFFAEKGLMTINTTYDNFLAEAKIEGSENQKIYENYKKMLSGFSDKNLNYLKEQLEARIKGDTLKADSIQKLSDKNLLRTYQFTITYVLQHKNKEIAPYITLTKAENITIKYLDSINNSLLPEIADSKYGKALKDYIKTVKEKNNN